MFLINLTEKAKKGELPSLIGQEKAKEHLFRILLRKTKNNPLLIGEHGIGKTTLVYGLAKNLAENSCPAALKGVSLMTIDFESLILENPSEEAYTLALKNTLQELVSQKGKVLLFLQDLGLLAHLPEGAEKEEIQKFMRIALKNKSLHLILETDIFHYKAYIEKNFFLSEEFQPLFMEAVSPKDAALIINGMKERLIPSSLKIEIPEDVVEEAIALTVRYLKSRPLPEKAIDLLDETLSFLALNKKEASLLTKEHLNSVMSEWTGIPLDKIDSEDKKRLANAEETLKKRVVGQDNAVLVVANALRRARSGLQDPKRPIGSFLFIGTTGVGKTELAKSLAEFMFDDETALLRLDMSEYMERNSVARLIGAPPGTAGFEQGGLLTESVRLHPFQVVLFDEIEKANPDILNLLLQLLDDGRLTDTKGTTVDFRNTIVIMTSNVGANLPGYQRVDALTQYFRPEFLNRIDDIVSFHQLSEEHLLKIVDIHLGKFLKRAASKGYSISVNAKARAWLVDEVFTSKFGVRALKRLIQNEIENPLAALIMQEKVTSHHEVLVTPDEAGKKLKIYAKEK
ncbi:MAG: ATP-dependent Clp protease ATP-binding subunit [Alphaproteobacteria bacterium]|nr:ATP-dependent Clp protease ATP-binding subunit [Alphaproteobacteria bacterium]